MTDQSASRRERRRTSPSQSLHARGGTTGTNAPAPISTTCKNKIWLAGTVTTNKCAAFEEQKKTCEASGEQRCPATPATHASQTAQKRAHRRRKWSRVRRRHKLPTFRQILHALKRYFKLKRVSKRARVVQHSDIQHLHLCHGSKSSEAALAAKKK